MSYRSYEISYLPCSDTLFEQLLDRTNPVLLRSDPDGFSYQLNRWDIFSADPVECLIDYHRSAADQIQASIKRHTSAYPDSELPFVSGAIGLLGYDAGESAMGICRSTGEYDLQTRRWPSLLVGIYQWAVVTDHLTQKRWLVADEKLSSETWQALHSEFAAYDRTRHPPTAGEQLATGNFKLTSEWHSSFARQQYAAAFYKLKQYILDGDCYQANLTQQFAADYQGDIWPAARAAWRASPAPFAAFFGNGEKAVVSCSPECFIQIANGKVTTRPIKGTRARGITLDEDRRQSRELHHSVKDKAENLMIVDLMRNDLGRFCKTGTVAVPGLFDIESFSNVHHLVSTITGQISAADAGRSLELLFGCLPGGSITGAPKKRAMEIIAELEPHPRSIYCGTLFYLSGNGNLNSSIMIRSLLFEGDSDGLGAGKVYCWGGGGIVADSELETEFNESRIKVRNLLDALSAMQ